MISDFFTKDNINKLYKELETYEKLYGKYNKKSARIYFDLITIFSENLEDDFNKDDYKEMSDLIHSYIDVQCYLIKKGEYIYDNDEMLKIEKELDLETDDKIRAQRFRDYEMDVNEKLKYDVYKSSGVYLDIAHFYYGLAVEINEDFLWDEAEKYYSLAEDNIEIITEDWYSDLNKIFTLYNRRYSFYNNSLNIHKSNEKLMELDSLLYENLYKRSEILEASDETTSEKGQFYIRVVEAIIDKYERSKDNAELEKLMYYAKRYTHLENEEDKIVIIGNCYCMGTMYRNLANSMEEKIGKDTLKLLWDKAEECFKLLEKYIEETAHLNRFTTEEAYILMYKFYSDSKNLNKSLEKANEYKDKLDVNPEGYKYGFAYGSDNFTDICD